MSYEVDSNTVEVQNQKPLRVSNNSIDTVTAEPLVEATKKEYSIVGDALYASVNTEDAPQWLTNLIDATLSTKLDSKLSTLNTLNTSILQAIDEIQVAKNTYNEQINIEATVDNVIASKLTTLNAAVDDNSSNILTIQNTYASKTNAASIADFRIEASINNGTIKSKIDHLDKTITDSTDSLAQSVDVLESNISNVESGLSSIAQATDSLYTYTGFTGSGQATGSGLLADLHILQKQQDGIIDTFIGTYDVITYQDEAPADGVPDPDTIELVKTAEPYVNWLPKEGSGVPSGEAEVYSLYTDTDTDTRYEYTSSGWTEISENAFNAAVTALREIHVGDTYIKYETVNGQKHYLGAFKFIRTVIDDTSPYGTDEFGFTWAKITDTDSQNAFIKALQAEALADGKRRVFLVQPYGEQDPGDLWISTITDTDGNLVKAVKVYVGIPRLSGFSLDDWVVADLQAQHFIDTVYTPESTSLKNQIDGKIEYFFIRGEGTAEHPFTVSDEVKQHLINLYNNNVTAANHITQVFDPISTVQAVCASIGNIFSVTEKIREAANGNVLFFPDLEKQDTSTNTYGFWYESGRGKDTGVWRVITDVSVYKALTKAEQAQASADGVVVSFYAYESDVNPDIFTGSPEFSELQYWYDTSTSALKIKLGGIWVDYTKAKEGDTLSTVIVKEEVTDEKGNALPVAEYTVSDNNTYTLKNGTWVSITSKGMIATSRKYTRLHSYLSDDNGQLGGAGSELSNSIKVESDNAYTKATANFTYNSILNINGNNYYSGFGLKTYIDSDGNHDSEFLINAEKLRFTNTTGSGVVTPFRIDASGSEPDIVFKGKVTFGNNQEGYIEEAVAAAMHSITVGDKNINITDNIIPMSQFVLDDNNAGYEILGTHNKIKKRTLSEFTEATLILESDGECYSPYADDMTESYYYRFAIKGVTSLDGFKIINIRDLDSDSVLEDTDSYMVDTIQYYTPNSITTPTLNADEWYEVDGLLTPPGNPSTGSYGYIRDKNRNIIAHVQNLAIRPEARWLSLGWLGPCQIARVKLAVVTADTITSSAATESMVNEIYNEQEFKITRLTSEVNSITEDDIISRAEKPALIRDIDSIKAEKETLIGVDGLSGQCDLLGVIDNVDTSDYQKYQYYKQSYDVLVDYLQGLAYTIDGVTVTWDNVDYDTALGIGGGAQFRALVSTYNSNKTALLTVLQARIKSSIDSLSTFLGNPSNNSGEVVINKGVISADALVMGRDIIDTSDNMWTPKAGGSGVFLNNESINVIVNGVTRVRIGKLNNTLPSNWRF